MGEGRGNLNNKITWHLIFLCPLAPYSFSNRFLLVYAEVRKVVQPWDGDRFMSPDIEAACALVKSGKLIDLVEPYWRDDVFPRAHKSTEIVDTIHAAANLK